MQYPETIPSAVDVTDLPACVTSVSRPFLERVDSRLTVLFETERAEWASVHQEMGAGLDVLETAVLGGGKRLRPLFALQGYMSGGGAPDDEAIVDLACALELLHAFALVHDDIMDDSDTRRHRPSVHEQFRRLHHEHGWAGEARRNAESFAMLLGDLAFALSIRFEVDLPADVRIRLNQVRTELHVGQYLDLVAAATATRDPATAQDIARYKTSKYTVEGPLVLGATLAGNTAAIPVLEIYGDTVGEAFQHRDDYLGVFGDPAVTGKPRYDDLYAGKGSLLLHFATVLAADHPSVPLDLVGTPALTDKDAAAIAEFIAVHGAAAQLEARIDELVNEAILALRVSDLPVDTVNALEQLAYLAARRDR